MRLLIVLIAPLVLSACCAATPSAPANEADRINQTEQLVRYSLSDRLLANVRERIQDQLQAMLEAKKVAPQEAKRILEEELETVMATEEQRLLDSLVPVYRRYYTAEEISQLLSFYRTEVARKSQKVSSRIAAEIRQYVQLWNENFEETLLERVHARLAEEGLLSEQ